MDADGVAPAAGHEQQPQGAPIRLMTQFLRAVSEERMQDALNLTKLILKYEPDNSMVLEYQDVLRKCVPGGSGPASDTSDADESSSEDESVSGESTSSEEDTDTASCDGDGPEPAGPSQPKETSSSGGVIYESKNALADQCKAEAHLASVMQDLRLSAATKCAADRAAWDPAQFAPDGELDGTHSSKRK
eukprot:TRINITY_DN2887_c0_g1_i1.p1 TRINITY_DN2887_c0_g1~~TRINITY_DN2887_c0_g1_i1.p1  ORF type:complete len:189 (+),score=30.14 TRINITY_DN2887_c0_g1_i1:54-620(+)